MKKTLLITGLFIGLVGCAQIEEPVKFHEEEKTRSGLITEFEVLENPYDFPNDLI